MSRARQSGLSAECFGSDADMLLTNRLSSELVSTE